MRVSIIGVGHVGLVTAACLAHRGHEVLGVDSDAAKVASLEQGKAPIFETGLDELIAAGQAAGRLRFSGDVAEAVAHGQVVFICVGTPAGERGRSNLYFIERVAREVAAHLRAYRVIVEKSTVPVHTSRRIARTIRTYGPPGADFDVVSNPEFLREGSAVRDTLEPDRIIVGTASTRARQVMAELYAGFTCPLILTDANSAELIKHASNAYLAMRVSFINAVARVCHIAGADVTEVARGMGLDARIGTHFLQAGLGWGGSCFPKDLRAFSGIAEDLGYPFGLLREVAAINEDQLVWFCDRLEAELWHLEDKRLGVWGLAFKPGTDDVRESRGLALVERLLIRGGRLRVYDPHAMASARRVLGEPERLTYAGSALEAIADADALVVATEWDEFAAITPETIARALRVPLVFDGRNLWDPEAMRAAGLAYHSIGRPDVRPA